MAKIAGLGFTAEVKGDKLVIEVDLKSELGDSGSGKNTMIAKTGANMPLGGGVSMGLNVYKKK